eukprot:2720898-Rhodomonas_salina.2
MQDLYLALKAVNLLGKLPHGLKLLHHPLLMRAREQRMGTGVRGVAFGVGLGFWVGGGERGRGKGRGRGRGRELSLIHISEPTRPRLI